MEAEQRVSSYSASTSPAVQEGKISVTAFYEGMGRIYSEVDNIAARTELVQAVEAIKTHARALDAGLYTPQQFEEKRNGIVQLLQQRMRPILDEELRQRTIAAEAADRERRLAEARQQAATERADREAHARRMEELQRLHEIQAAQAEAIRRAQGAQLGMQLLQMSRPAWRPMPPQINCRTDHFGNQSRTTCN